MNMTLTISAARTIDFETLTDSNTAKTFVLGWVRPKAIIDKPLYKLFAAMLFSGDTAYNLRQLKKGCYEKLFQDYAAKTRLDIKELYNTPAFAAAINHYAGEKDLYINLMHCDDFDPVDRLCLDSNNRSLLLAEVLCSLTDELVSETLN